MAQRNNLYRRSSGIYVLRLTVPVRFRLLLGQREIHASTASSNPAQARAVACGLLGLWDQCLSELEMVDRGQRDAESEPAPKGEKDAETRFNSFDEALAYLKAMPVAKWRRPNDAGNWGLVTAVRWGKLNE